MHISYFYDIPLPTYYAASIQIINTCRALCEQGASVTIYANRLMTSDTRACLDFYGLEPHQDLRIVSLYGHPLNVVLLQRKLDAALRRVPESEPHFVISRGESGIALFERLRRLERPAGRRHIYEAHRLCFTELADGKPPRRDPRTRRRVERAVVRTRRLEQSAVERVDGLVCLTEGVRAALQREFHITCPTLVLPSGTRLVTQELARPINRDIDILYAGKLERRKGIQDLIAAMQFLPEYRLTIVGGTAQQVVELTRQAERLDVAGRVTFTGPVSPAQVGRLYARARVGVCPLPIGESRISEEFTSPLKVLEMMAHGLAIVGTDLPALRALLEHDQTALLVPPSDPKALAGAIRTLLEDRARAARLTQAAQARIADYSWEQRARRLLEFLTALASRSGPALTE